MMKVETKLADPPIDDSSIPEGTIAIYAEGMSKPVYLKIEKELILGRKGLDVDDSSNGSILNLSELGGYQMGISRQHAMIRRAETRYELIDLASTNGSWLNDERLIPNNPYPLANGSQLRFGRMRLLVLYHSVPKTKTMG
jgi:pSer/pThr/pTyr-binding forkhead associated (FHA) protein